MCPLLIALGRMVGYNGYLHIAIDSTQIVARDARGNLSTNPLS